MAIIQQTFKEALGDCHLQELPQEGDVNGDWTEAVALVKRAVGGVQSYAVVRKDDGAISVVKDFGLAYQCSAIAEISKVYPLAFGVTEEGQSFVDEQQGGLESQIFDNGQETVTDAKEVGDFLASLQGKEFDVDVEPTSTEEAERLAKLPVQSEKGTTTRTTRKTTAKRGRPRKSTRK